MKIQLIDFDNLHYASNVIQFDNMLKWDALGNSHSLIVRTGFDNNVSISNLNISALERINNDLAFSGQEIKLDDDYCILFCHKGYVNNYTITTFPATYAIFCCSYDQVTDVCKLYVPNDACMYQCKVKSQIDVNISSIVVKKRLFSKSTGKFYSVVIPQIPGYVDGSLQYTFDRSEYFYPITNSMLGKPFYVCGFNDNPPRIFSTNGNGYEITIR